MLVTCPNCSTHYTVPDMAVGMKGRTMRCSRCQHQWQQPFVASQPEARPKRPEARMVTEPAREKRAPVMVSAFEEPGEEEAPIEDDLLAAAMRAEEQGEDAEAGAGEGGGGGNPFDRIAEMMMEQPPAPIPDMFASPAMERPRRRGVLGLLVLALVLLLVIVGGGLYLFQYTVINYYPAAAKYYDKLHARNEVPGAGLEFHEVSSERGQENGHEVLIVRGLVHNSTDQMRAVPPFWLVLYDGSTPLQNKIIEPPQDTLDPKGTVSFKVSLDQVDPHATRFEVTFAQPKSAAATKEGATPAADQAPAK